MTQTPADRDEAAWHSYDNWMWIAGDRRRRGPMVKAAFIAGRASVRAEVQPDATTETGQGDPQ